MQAFTLAGNPPIDITVRRSSRARRYSLRISNSGAEVTLTLPTAAPLQKGLTFARSREKWIRAKLGNVPVGAPLRFGGTFPYTGREMTLGRATGTVSHVVDACILLAASEATIGASLRAFCKVTAREKIGERVDFHAGQLGRRVTRISLRDTKSRWGSCSQTGNLMFSWRLIMAPEDVLDYVVAHEVAHLEEMNHSARFWNVVGRLKPDFEPHRLWLRENGRTLLCHRL